MVKMLLGACALLLATPVAGQERLTLLLRDQAAYLRAVTYCHAHSREVLGRRDDEVRALCGPTTRVQSIRLLNGSSVEALHFGYDRWLYRFVAYSVNGVVVQVQKFD
jgi:hypothetical protein